MSRLFNDRVWVSIGVDRVVLERRSGWFGRASTGKVEYPISDAAGGRVAATLRTLESALGESRWQSARARVTLSNALVRYSIVPVSSQVCSVADERSLAGLRMQQVHGASAPSLELRLSSPLSGRRQLAAGVESLFLEGLRAALSRARLQTVAIEPLLMRAFNASRSRLASREFLFACIEPGLLGLGCVRAGAWYSLTFAPIVGGAAAALTARVREASLAADDARQLPRQMYLHAEGVAASFADDIEGVRCVVLGREQRH